MIPPERRSPPRATGGEGEGRDRAECTPDPIEGATVTAETAALLAFDVDAAIREAKRRPLPPPEVLAAARRRNKLSALRYLEAAARRGETGGDEKTSELLARLRRDQLRAAGLDERLVRAVR